MESIEQRNILVSALRDKITDYFKKVGFEEFARWQERSIKIIMEHYPDGKQRESYQLYHLLVGGSGGEDCLNFDFLGECSIQKIIEGLEV